MLLEQLAQIVWGEETITCAPLRIRLLAEIDIEEIFNGLAQAVPIKARLYSRKHG